MPFQVVVLKAFQMTISTSPSRWRQQGPTKLWYPSASLHGVKAQTTTMTTCVEKDEMVVD
jgi:hypothetical protein